MIIELQCLVLFHFPNPTGLVPKPLHIAMTSRKSLERDNKNKSPEFPKISSTISDTNAEVTDT